MISSRLFRSLASRTTFCRSTFQGRQLRYFSDPAAYGSPERVGITVNKLQIDMNDPKMKPPPKGDEVPPHIQDLADKVGGLTVTELVIFLNACAKKMGVPIEQVMNASYPPYYPYQGNPGWGAQPPPPGGYQQAPPYPQPGTPTAQPTGAASAVQEEPKKEEKKGFSVRMTKVDEGSKYKVLKEFRTLKPGLSIADSKKFVENLPSLLVENVPKEEAEKWAKAMGAAGGECVIE